MIMTTNEVLTRQNFVTKLSFKNDDAELSKDLKVKIMAMRIEYSKVRKQFDADLQEFIEGASTDEFKELRSIPEASRTVEQNERFNELVNEINSECNAYIITRGNENVDVKNISFTEEEYFEIVNVNAGNDVEINGTKLSSADFLEVLYTLFVE